MSRRAAGAWIGLAAWSASGLAMAGWLVAPAASRWLTTAPAALTQSEAPAELSGPRPPFYVPNDQENRSKLEHLRQHGRGLYRELAAGRFRYGDGIAGLLAEHKPDVVFDHGPFTTAVYANGHYPRSLSRVIVVAERGRLVRAQGESCEGDTVYFAGPTEAAWTEWEDGYQKARAADLAAWRQQQDR
ncbi:MAG: hypothetical protein K2X82_14095 [Gemmataceae bacterium]|nr:hypothetical protein [Gemmataceae bacterium]